MPEIRIPEEQCKSLAKLARLSEPQVNELVLVVEGFPAATTFKELSNRVPGKLTTLDPAEVKGFLETVFSMHMVRAYFDSSVADFLKEILLALGKEGEALTSGDRERLVTILNRLLDVKSLATSAKAHALQREHLLVLHDTRILCDLRPVFESPSEPPVGLVVAYTLHIVFHKGTHHEDIYFALDANDVAKLRAVVERAELKASSLKLLLSEKGLNQVG
jgi:hypothetical protein